MAKEVVTLDGYEGVFEALRAAKDVARARLVDKIQDAKRQLAQNIRVVTPYETGALRESIEATTPKGLTGFIGIRSGEIRGRRPDIYYRFLEYGTQHIPAKSYIRGPTNAFADQFIGLIRSAGKEMEKDLTTGRGTL
jgi:hypothetical protein